jgi:hypothetical protein
MTQAHYIEIRSRRDPGEAEPTTIIREVHSQNGKGRKTVRILRGPRVLSDVSEPLRPSENSNIQSRTFSPGLYKSSEKKTLKKMSKKTRKQKPRRVST